jgi:predicted 3-demethylubiquinone-9 3-methyltransferase (glyoxalase superfamily)
MVSCRNQEEIDYFWAKLSAVPGAEQCGWVKDRYGVSWQIVPENLADLMGTNPEKTTPVLLQMKKIVIEDLIRAGESS